MKALLCVDRIIAPVTVSIRPILRRLANFPVQSKAPPNVEPLSYVATIAPVLVFTSKATDPPSAKEFHTTRARSFTTGGPTALSNTGQLNSAISKDNGGV